jgi:hypothetical protein
VDNIIANGYPQDDILYAINYKIQPNDPDKKIAATQIDAIAHSMGGLIFRKYINGPNYKRDDNYQKGDVHKLITVDTPHFGSPLANYLFDNEKMNINGFNFEIWKKLHGDYLACVECGGTADLRIDSPLITGMSKTEVPAHAIVGIGGTDIQRAFWQLPWAYGKDAAAANLWYFLWKIDYILSPPHDLIVEQYSQEGGLNNPNYISLFDWESSDNPAVHGTVIRENRIRLKAIELLNSSITSDYFSSQFPEFSNFKNNATTISNVLSKTFNEIPELLSIVSPLPGTMVLSGEPIQITVEPQFGFIPDAMLIMGHIVENPPFTVQVEIPIETLGQIEIFAIAFDANGNLARSNKIIIEALTNSNLLGITLMPKNVYLNTLTPKRALQVYGEYDDGAVRDLSPSIRGTIYQSNNPSIATVDSEGFVSAISIGKTFISAFNGDYTDVVNIDVLEVYTPMDSDNDGLSDLLEGKMCTDIYNPDTDGDGIIDGDEDANHNGVIDPGETNPCSSYKSCLSGVIEMS